MHFVHVVAVVQSTQFATEQAVQTGTRGSTTLM